jgi:hypothetical protein
MPLVELQGETPFVEEQTCDRTLAVAAAISRLDVGAPT